MARRRSTTLNILLNGRHLGALTRATDGAIEFRYARDWLDWPHAMPVSLSLPLSDRRYAGGSVSAVFDNLLPDNDEIRKRVAERVGAEGYDSYSLLSSIGRDCVGALQFLPEDQEPTLPGEIEAEPIEDEQIGQMLDNLAKAPLGIKAEDAFRISIAGAQEKTALLWWKGQWHKPMGTTPTTHIFKPQIGRLPNGIDLSNSVENEHFCMTLMAELGLATAETQVAHFGKRPVLIVKRFDREWGRGERLLRRPQEDMCQALSFPPSRKYEDHGGPGVVQIMELLRTSDQPNADRRTFMKTMITFWLIGATDGHAKNFSIFLMPGGRFALTPLYDILSAEPSVAAHQINLKQARLAMAIGDKRRYRIGEIAPRHFLQSAVKSGFDEKPVVETLSDLRATGEAALERTIASARAPNSIAEPIANAFMKRLRLIDLM